MSQIPTLRGRRSEPEELETEGTWAISYGDMLTLLLAFFILFFSIDKRTQQEGALKSSLLTTLSPLQKARPFIEAKPDLYPINELERDLQVDWKAKVRQVENKVVIEFPGVSFYGSGATDVNEKGREILRNFAKLYVPFAGKHMLTVVGFADSRPIHQKHRYNDNLELSVLRSVSALKELQTAGIPLSRIRLGGYGVSQSESDRLKELVGKESQDDVTHSMARKIILIVEVENAS